jgi:phosphoribosyl 1,2-cyclic phosphodiesterase
MILKILGSSSRGNCYILENNHEALIIEAGISFSHVRRALDLKHSQVVGCLISHEHGDHARFMSGFAKSGINLLASESVFKSNSLGRHSKMGIVIQAGMEYVLGDFTVSPFTLNHDVPCLGFLIDHPDSGLIGFISDTRSCDYVIPGLNHIIIECNYAKDILEANIRSGRVHHTRGKRVLLTHLELESCKKTLQLNDLSAVSNIVLAHLSPDNSDAGRFREEVAELTKKNVFVAGKGIRINFTGIS